MMTSIAATAAAVGVSCSRAPQQRDGRERTRKRDTERMSAIESECTTEKKYTFIYIYMFVCTGGDDGNSTLRLLYIPWSAAFNRSPTLSSTAVTARALTAARPPSIVHPPCPIRPPSVCVRDAAWSTNNNRPPARSSFHFRPSVHVRRRSLYARRVRHLRPPLRTIIYVRHPYASAR